MPHSSTTIAPEEESPVSDPARSFRESFDLPTELTYLNTSFMSPLLHRVRKAAVTGIDGRARPWEIGVDDFFAPDRQLRELSARLLGGRPTDYAIVPSVSYAVETAIANFDIPEGSQIIVLDEQFPANIYPWRAAAAKNSAELVTVYRPEDDDWAAAVERKLSRRTAVVSIPCVHWTTGARIDLERLSRSIRSVGARFFADATQGAGVLDLNVSRIDPDFLATACYKYMLGPYGMCLMYASPEFQERGRVIEHGWLNRDNSHRFDRLTEYSDTYRPGALRFDQGERADGIKLLMTIEAILQLLEWGRPLVETHCRKLCRHAMDRADVLKIGHPERERTSSVMLGLDLPDGYPSDIADRLRESKIIINLRGPRIRFSVHAHNNEADVDRFFETVARILGR
ncbi:MAG: aminotransferase class V-fold PLP-dependent enzyme [Planctomycetota bacterium]